MGGGADGISYNITAFNRWNDERNVNVNQSDNDWNDNWWFAGVRTFAMCGFVVYAIPLYFNC